MGLIDDDGAVRHAAGVWDGLSALLAAEAGYEALFLSGAAVAASAGLPDAELTTLDDLLRTVRRVVDATDLPLLVDVDTGFGDAVTLHHAVTQLRRAGAAAIMLEDQRSPRPGAIAPGEPPPLASVAQVAGKIAAARDAAAGEVDVVVRSDAAAEHLSERLGAYARAGADVLFPLVFDDALPLEQWGALHRRTGLPLACTHAPGSWVERTMTDEVAADVGIGLVVQSLHGMLAAVTAVRRTFGELRAGTPPWEVSAGSVPYREVVRLVGEERVRTQRGRWVRD